MWQNFYSYHWKKVYPPQQNNCERLCLTVKIWDYSANRYKKADIRIQSIAGPEGAIEGDTLKKNGKNKKIKEKEGKERRRRKAAGRLVGQAGRQGRKEKKKICLGAEWKFPIATLNLYTCITFYTWFSQKAEKQLH